MTTQNTSHLPIPANIELTANQAVTVLQTSHTSYVFGPEGGRIQIDTPPVVETEQANADSAHIPNDLLLQQIEKRKLEYKPLNRVKRLRIGSFAAGAAIGIIGYKNGYGAEGNEGFAPFLLGTWGTCMGHYAIRNFLRGRQSFNTRLRKEVHTMQSQYDLQQSL